MCVLSITKQVAIKPALGLLNLVLNLIDLPRAKVIQNCGSFYFEIIYFEAISLFVPD